MRGVERMLPIETMISGNVWPAIPPAPAAGVLAMLFQLEQSQWWPAEVMRQHQFEQLAQVLDHASRTVPFYRERLDTLGWAPGQPVSPEQWRRLPLLRRQDVQQAGEALVSTAFPPDHGNPFTKATSGATGMSVQTKGTAVTQFFWSCLNLRDHLWHRRDFSLRLAAIRHLPNLPPGGEVSPNWGTPTRGVLRTGPCACLNIDYPVSQKAEWLRQQAPGYLLSHPSNVLALARWFAERQETLPGLLDVRTFGEVLEPHVRAACREAWGVSVVDTYSCQEVGVIALQCPENELYHVQAESLLVEVLDDAGRPCEPGQIGRVVVTTLHNFATPLLRYALGDYAEVGGPCPCGRGLPVLTRVLGRQRNILTVPSGEQFWPAFGGLQPFLATLPKDFPPIRQFQAIQRTLHTLEVKLVALRPLRPEEEEALRTALQNYAAAQFGYHFTVSLTYADEIPRSPGGKFEDFRSEL